MKNHNFGLLILRLSLGVLLLLHGIAKLTKGVSFIEGIMESMGLPAFFAYSVYVGEILAPIFMIIGFRTRVAAVLYICTMLVAVFGANADKLNTILPSGGWGVELQALFLFGALALFFTGGGKFAVSTSNRWD